MTDDGVFNKFLEFLSSLNDGKPAGIGDILKKHHDEICLLKERIKVLEEQDHSTINAPSPIVKRYVARSNARIAILECLSDGKKKTIDDFVGVSGTSKSNIYHVLRGKRGTLKNPIGGLLVSEPRLKYSIHYEVNQNTPTYLFWLEDEIPSRLKTKPVKHPPIKID